MLKGGSCKHQQRSQDSDPVCKLTIEPATGLKMLTEDRTAPESERKGFITHSAATGMSLELEPVLPAPNPGA